MDLKQGFWKSLGKKFGKKGTIQVGLIKGRSWSWTEIPLNATPEVKEKAKKLSRKRKPKFFSKKEFAKKKKKSLRLWKN